MTTRTEESTADGWLASVRRLGDTGLSLLHTRLSLASLELAEEKDRLLGLLAGILLGISLIGSALLTLGLLLVVAFWDTHRVLVIGLVALAYLVGGLGVLAWVRHAAREAPTPLQGTLDELARDRDSFNAGIGADNQRSGDA